METINVKQEMDDLIRKFENKEIDIEALTIGCFNLGKRVQSLMNDAGKTMPPIDWANFPAKDLDDYLSSGLEEKMKGIETGRSQKVKGIINLFKGGNSK